MTDKAKVVGVYHRGIDNARDILEAMTDTRFDVLLKAEPNNVFDPNAIAVYVCGQKFGYISHNDIPKVPIRTSRLAIADEVLLGETSRVVDVEHGSFEIEFSVDHLFRINGFDETGREWENWHPTCFASQPQLTFINDIQADIDMLLHLNHINNKAKLIQVWSEGLRKIGCIPLWREAQQDITNLISSYENSDSDTKKSAAEELRHMISAIGSPKHRQEYVEVWWKQLLASDEMRQFVLMNNQITPEEVMKDLTELPGKLFFQLTDRVSLFSSIYYRRIPLAQWSDLIRLIALHDILTGGSIETKLAQYNIGCNVQNDFKD